MNKKLKILLVDDDESIRITLGAKILKHSGISCDVARDGQEALEMMAVSQPNIVITDTNMPNKNGIELIKEVREKYPQVVIFSLFSGLFGSDISKEDIQQLGVFMVLEKYEINTLLLSALEKFVGSRMAM